MATNYYRPFLPSDSENSDSDSDKSWSPRSSTPRPDDAEEDILSKNGPDFAALARALSDASAGAIKTAGPTFETLVKEDQYGKNRLDPRIAYSPYVMKDVSGAELKTESRGVDTVLILRSKDRDKSVFPQPTNCQLFLPRTYKNVTKFSIVQLNLISAFFYFSQVKNNIAVSIEEEGRTTYLADSTIDPTNTNKPLIMVNTMREGSYTIDTLLTELNTQLNKTPIFFDFINGFTDFAVAFVVSGDYSLNFNYPGDNFYEALSKTFIPTPTREIIASYYFQTRYAVSYDFTQQQVINAYYFPVLKEAVLDPNTNLNDYNLAYESYTRQQSINYVLYSFTGLDDPVITILINNNIAQLDKYRLFHTFRYSLVNKYVCTYNTTNNRVTIASPSLNTSLSNLLVTEYNSLILQELANNGLTSEEYNSLSATITGLLSLIQGMYSYMQTSFAKYFAVDYGTYSRSYFTNSNNSILLRPGLIAKGTNFLYTTSNIRGARSIDSLNDYKTPPKYYWPYMTGLGETVGPPINMGNTTDTYPLSSNYPLNLASSNIDFSRDFIDSNGYIYTDNRRKAGDILVNIQASKYTVFKFRSNFRQTLQVETLPRQTNFRYPAWNAANPIAYPLAQLYDISYSYIEPTGILQSNLIRDISYNAVAGWSTMTNSGKDNVWNTSTNFSASFTTSSNFWGSAFEQIDVTNSNGRVYRFIAPYPVDSNIKGSNVYKYPMQISVVGETAFTEDYYAFFYHDVTALAADVSVVGTRNESIYNYKYRLTISSNTLSNSYLFNAYAGQNYYMLLRSESISPISFRYKVIPWCPSGNVFTTLSQSVLLADGFNPLADPTTMLSNFNAAKNNDPDYIRLPILDDFVNPSTLTNQIQTDTINIGYDASGVSTDLTDYVPFEPFATISTINPIAKFRIDPITDYVFQYNTPYDLSKQNYLSSNSSNAILTKGSVRIYTPKPVSIRQYKIAQYYGTNFIQNDTDYNTSNISSNIPPYTINTTGNPLGGYKYNNNILTLDGGVSGFTFLPPDGTWAIDRLTFKTNFINNISDNSNIHCMGIFFTSDIYAIPTTQVSLKNAVGILLRVQDKIYNSSNLNLGCDSAYGTYHTFSNYLPILSQQYPTLGLRSNFNISGFSQGSKTFIPNVNTYYSAVAFNFVNIVSWNTSQPDLVSINEAISTNKTFVYNIQNLVGTPIPYPLAGTVSTSSVFYDGAATPSGQDLVISSPIPASNIYGPTVAGADESISAYEQSIPIINSHLHYKTPASIISDSIGFQEWSGLSIIPNYMYSSVYDNNIKTYRNPIDPNTYSWKDVYVLMQGDSFSILKYKYYTKINNYTQPDREFSFVGNLSLQQIFPDNEKTSLISVAGNSTHYVFLGSSNSYLRFKEYNPITGILTELTQNPYYTFDPTIYDLQHFVYNDARSWFISAEKTNANNVVLIGAPKYSETLDNIIQYSNIGLTKSELQIDEKNVYFSPYASNGFTRINVYSLNPTDNQYVGDLPSISGRTINLDLTPVASYPFYTQFTLTTINDFLLLNTVANPHGYYKIRSFQTSGIDSNTQIDFSVQLFKNSLNQFVTPRTIMSGAFGSKWLLLDSFGYIMGNRADAYDASPALSIAWQIFFPTMKIEMRNLTTYSRPMTDLTDLTYPEWPHTAMFAYSNYTTLSNDIYANGGQWGLESNFIISDVSFNGFYFNSYMMDVPLTKSSSNPTNSNDYYYIAVRSYLPVESAQVMMRFSLPNRYDFGFVTLGDIVNEIDLISTVPYLFNPEYLNTLISFDSNFIMSNRVFGSNAIQAISGSNITSSNFGDFFNQYNKFYSDFLIASSNLQNIQSNLKKGIANYISSNLKYILPSNAFDRQRFTAPILSKFLWSTALNPIYSEKEDNWGLGWNLGYLKRDTDFSIYHTADSFFKIQEDFIYLRMNPEFNMNGLDAGGKEDYKSSREPSGITKQYYCKLLLTSFGGNATTFVHQPIDFNIALNRLIDLRFQWIDSDGAIINNNDSEWDMTINITEQRDIVTVPINNPIGVLGLAPGSGDLGAGGIGAGDLGAGGIGAGDLGAGGIGALPTDISGSPTDISGGQTDMSAAPVDIAEASLSDSTNGNVEINMQGNTITSKTNEASPDYLKRLGGDTQVNMAKNNEIPTTTDTSVDYLKRFR